MNEWLQSQLLLASKPSSINRMGICTIVHYWCMVSIYAWRDKPQLALQLWVNSKVFLEQLILALWRHIRLRLPCCRNDVVAVDSRLFWLTPAICTRHTSRYIDWVIGSKRRHYDVRSTDWPMVCVTYYSNVWSRCGVNCISVRLDGWKNV